MQRTRCSAFSPADSHASWLSFSLNSIHCQLLFGLLLWRIIICKAQAICQFVSNVVEQPQFYWFLLILAITWITMNWDVESHWNNQDCSHKEGNVRAEGSCLSECCLNAYSLEVNDDMAFTILKWRMQIHCITCRLDYLTLTCAATKRGLGSSMI